MRLQVVFSAVEGIWVAVSANVGLASETVICETEAAVVLSSFGLEISSEVSVSVHGRHHSSMISQYVWSVLESRRQLSSERNEAGWR